MNKPTCDTCPYFYRVDQGYGDCRESSPRPTPQRWPRVRAGEGCGRHPQFAAYLAGYLADIEATRARMEAAEKARHSPALQGVDVRTRKTITRLGIKANPRDLTMVEILAQRNTGVVTAVSVARWAVARGMKVTGLEDFT